jgi:thioredoxin reductase (NADPH)
MVIATGMEYRQHPAHGVETYTGAGVYYGAAMSEAPAFSDKRVLVVGGGNSAGQAALYLSGFARNVLIVSRRDSLRPTMSQYLIDHIDRTPNISTRFRTELTRVEGNGCVERVALKHEEREGEVEAIDAVFMFIGTKPRSEWLLPDVLRDAKGFVLTGRDLPAQPAYARIWKEGREPMALETSVPGVFAAGDIRAGAMNRVASAVGEEPSPCDSFTSTWRKPDPTAWRSRQCLTPAPPSCRRRPT